MLQKFFAAARPALLASLLTLSGVAALAETPSPGSAERRAILDAARAPLATVFRQPVVFRVDTLNVDQGWAFVLARMSAAGGAPLEYIAADMQEAAAAGGVSTVMVALLRKDAESGWKLVEQAVGPTDVAWEPWASQHAAPSELFILLGEE